MKYLVDFHHGATETDINQYMSENSCTVLKEWDNFDKVFLVETSNTPPLTNIVERVALDEGLAIRPMDAIVLNPYWGTHNDPSKETINVTVGNTQDWWKNYSYSNPVFDGPSLTLARLGQNFDIYLMDSGIESSHPEFVNANIVNLYSVDPNDFSDSIGHGTALASVMVGATCGITNANLKIVKITDPNVTTMLSDVLNALDLIITDHADNTYAVVNCSWVIPKNEYVEHKFKILADEGVFIMAAAGNNGTSIEDMTPASMMEALTVGAYNQNLVPCNFSNYSGGSIVNVNGENAVNHGELDGWAPGEMIYTAGLNGTYGYTAGTSIATAIASAVLASNLSWHLDNAGQVLLGYQGTVVSTAVPGSNTYVMARKDLLDLSDPKYANSVNLIATLKDRTTMPVQQSTDEHTVFARVNDPKALVRVYEPTLTKQIEFITPLPDNFTLLPDGRVYAAATSVQGPASGENYKVYNSSFLRTNLNDLTETINLQIYVFPENFDPGSLPPEDQPLYIQLTAQGVCNGFPSFCSLAGSPTTCSDSCLSYCCGGNGGKSTFACDCG